ncbi:MAG: hypothetical protein FD168_965 [Desulfobulbaceae bacterium]|nr:MAG: hypothetical protein FD168_965 [Desulfobulbaceae bacterium]
MLFLRNFHEIFRGRLDVEVKKMKWQKKNE